MLNVPLINLSAYSYSFPNAMFPVIRDAVFTELLAYTGSWRLFTFDFTLYKNSLAWIFVQLHAYFLSLINLLKKFYNILFTFSTKETMLVYFTLAVVNIM
jgi:hypothetical protein